MFKIAITETYVAPVTVQIPGEKSPRKFDLEFLRRSQAEIEALVAKIKDGALTDAQLCHEVVVGWPARNITDSEGTDVAFSTDALDRLLGIYPLPSAIVQAYFNSISSAREKNLLPQPAGGR
jgi:hypothetical protein